MGCERKIAGNPSLLALPPINVEVHRPLYKDYFLLAKRGFVHFHVSWWSGTMYDTFSGRRPDPTDAGDDAAGQAGSAGNWNR